MIVRQATINDLDHVLTLFEKTLAEIPYYNELAKRTERSHYTYDKIRRKLEDDPFSIIVCEIESRIVGICLNRFDDYTVWLEWIIAEESWRKQGVGAAMLHELTEFSLKRSCHKIWCDCRTSNFISKKFLENNGFVLIAEVKNHWYKQDFNLFEKVIETNESSTTHQ